MRQVGKTLYVLNDEAYIHCDNHSIAVEVDGKTTRIAYHVIDLIVLFGYSAVSSFLVYHCSQHGIEIVCVSLYGRFLGSFAGPVTGNVLLREKQFAMLSTDKAINYVRNVLAGKLRNAAWMLISSAHHNAYHDDLMMVASDIRDKIRGLQMCQSIDDMRILEAECAKEYFTCIDKMLKVSDPMMEFDHRSKRPPENRMNAALSFFYTLMTSLCSTALQTAGLDSECGYLHVLRPGRHSLACDLVEEFRACAVDRFVINAVNRKELVMSDFIVDQRGIRFSKDAMKKILSKWDVFLMREMQYELYDKKLPLKTIVFEQARLLAQYVRGDIDQYPPYRFS